MQMSGGRFSVRAVSPNRMIQLFMSKHAPGRSYQVVGPGSPAAAAAAGGAGAGAGPGAGGPSSPSAAAQAPPQPPAADLVSWVQQSGGSISGVTVRRDESGFGLAAAADCAAGTTLIQLPRQCHLTYDASTDPRLLALIDQVPAELWGAKLALAVVAHRLLGAASAFSPYINNLPLGVAGLPMFYDGPTLGLLQYPPVVEQVKRRCRWLLSFTQQALAPVRGTDKDPFDGAELDANALGWALAVVTSRAFRARGPGQPAAMLPLIDMANHSFEPNAKIAPGPGGSMCMVATRPLREGEPVVISYGALQNDFLLMDYGFVVPMNPHETVQLRFDRGLVEAAKAVAGVGGAGGPDQEDGLPPLPAWQQKELVALGLEGPQANTEVSVRRQAGEAEGPIDPRLLAGVRVLCAPNPAALGGRSGVEGLGRWGAPIAPAAELAALKTLTGLVAIALSQFQGSLEDDAKLLQAGATSEGAQQRQPELTDDQRLAIQFRMDKKQLLMAALGPISQRIQALAAAAGGGTAGGTGGSAAGGKAGGGKGKPKAKNGGKGFGG